MAALDFQGSLRGDLGQHFRLALEASRLGTWRWEVATGAVVWDHRLEEIYGFAPGSFPGTFAAYVERLHPEDRPRMMATVQDALATAGSYQVEHRVVWPDGTVRWVQGSGQVVAGPSGDPVAAIGCSLDITDLVSAREAVTRAARIERATRERLQFLARVNEVLGDAVTRPAVIDRMSQAMVPHLGDWCLLVAFDPDHPGHPTVTITHVDPAQAEAARLVADEVAWEPTETVGLAATLGAGHTVLLPEVTETALRAFAVPPHRRRALADLGARSLLGVPLLKLGRVLGAMVHVRGPDRLPFDTGDLALASAVAGRVASALENRRLTDEQRRIASTLQRSLLPAALPEVPGLDVAVRYWAAGEAAEVGGDFYDLFPLGEGRWAAVIGDVCGTGPVAASVTSLARHTLRLCAWRGDDPATALRWLNRALLEAGSDRFVTAAYVLLEPDDRGCRMTTTTAGHPLPVVVGAGRSARPIGRPGTLLGAFDEVALHTCTDRLGPGESLVLYTDGLYDVPPPHLLEEDEVHCLLSRAAASADGAEGLADHVNELLTVRLAMQDRSDDIALLVVRAV